MMNKAADDDGSNDPDLQLGMANAAANDMGGSAAATGNIEEKLEQEVEQHQQQLQEQQILEANTSIHMSIEMSSSTSRDDDDDGTSKDYGSDDEKAYLAAAVQSYAFYQDTLGYVQTICRELLE